MNAYVLLACGLILAVIFFIMYWDFRKNFKHTMEQREIDIQKLRKGLNDEINDKPIVDLVDAIKYNNERRK